MTALAQFPQSVEGLPDLVSRAASMLADAKTAAEGCHLMPGGLCLADEASQVPGLAPSNLRMNEPHEQQVQLLD